MIEQLGVASSQPSGPRRELGFDALRILAALAVVGVHITSFHAMRVNAGEIPMDFESLLNTLLNSFVIPLFLFVAGMFSWGREFRGGVKGYGRFLKRRSVGLLVPYVFWSTVFLLVFGVLQKTLAFEGRLATLKLFAVTLWQGTAFWHMTFIPVLFFLLLFTPLASAAFRKAPGASLAACVALSAAWMGFVSPGDPGTMALVPRFLASVGWYLVFMALGAWFAVRRDQLHFTGRFWGFAFIVVWLILRTATYFYRDVVFLNPYVFPFDWPVVACGVLGLALLAGNMRSEGGVLTRGVKLLAPLTLSVYLAHPLLQEVVIRYGHLVGAAPLGTSRLWDFVAYIFVATASFALVWVGSKIPGVRTLFGVR